MKSAFQRGVTNNLLTQFELPDALSRDYLQANLILPLRHEDDRVLVAAAGIPQQHIVEDLIRLFRVPVEFVPASEAELLDAIRRAMSSSQSVVELVRDLSIATEMPREEAGTSDLRDLANQPPVVRFVNLLIREAHELRASDIHLDSTRTGLAVRFRIDGVLEEKPAPPHAMQEAVISRLKLLGQLDIAERRQPQDGRFRVRLEHRELDIRLATIPTHFGESATMRLLDRGGQPTQLDGLGMSQESLAAFSIIVARPHGIVLATGPTGSGKTTSLYAAIGMRNREAEKIVTVEDPIEYELPGVTQVGVSERTGLTFARALRSLVRHDPDVLMIGEMRDAETADIAVRAAMTGHLVLSTLHTNDAISAVPRLMDLGVAPYLVAATVEAVLAQRLVRRICGECREQYRADGHTVALLVQRPTGRVMLWRGRGCAACRGTGYLGRVGLFELLRVTDELKDLISRRAEARRLKEVADADGFISLRCDGWTKIQAGLTTLEEVLRVAQA